MVGTGETIEKYRKLLKACLMPEDGENLDLHLDSVVDMVEEQRAAHEMDGGGPDEPMDIRM
jgi:transcription factor MBP1